MKKESKTQEDHNYDEEHLPSVTRDRLRHDTIETVTNEKLSHNKIDKISMDYEHPLQSLLRTGAMRDGYTLRWEVYKVAGVPHMDALQSAFYLGWTPVPVSRVARDIIWDDFGKDELASKYIIYKDVMLIEIPTELYNKRQMHYTNMAEQKVNALDGVVDDMPHFSGIHRKGNKIQGF